MTAITPMHYVALAAMVFAIGAAGALLRRNVLILLMSIELMLNAANLVFVAYARAYSDLSGHAVAFLVMAVAAAESAVGLAVLLGAFRSRETSSIDAYDTLRDEL